MIALWLFLYLAWLIRNLGILTIEDRSWSTLFLVLPLLVLPLTAKARRQRPELFHGWPTRIAGMVALASSLILARLLMLDFWDTKRAGASILLALFGLGLQWVTLAQPEKTDGVRLWLWIAFWESVGAWHPALTPLGAGLGAALAAFGLFPKPPSPPASRHALGIWPTLLLLGMVLPKPAWDGLLEPTWAAAFACVALGVALTQFSPVRRLGEHLPSWLLLTGLALLFVAYPSSRAWVWGLGLGLLAGWALPRLRRPLPIVPVTAAFLIGLVLSFLLHANAGRPLLKHFVWVGAGTIAMSRTP